MEEEKIIMEYEENKIEEIKLEKEKSQHFIKQNEDLSILDIETGNTDTLSRTESKNKNLYEVIRNKIQNFEVNLTYHNILNILIFKIKIIYQEEKDYLLTDFMSIDSVKRCKFEEINYKLLKNLYLIKTKVSYKKCEK